MELVDRPGPLRKLKTIAGVSAGSVVAAMLAVGCQAEEIFKLVQELPFYQIALPELGSLDAWGERKGYF